MHIDYNHSDKTALIDLLDKSAAEIQRLQGMQDFLLRAFDLAPFPVIRLSCEGIIEEVNPSACKLFGHLREEFIGSFILQYLPEYHEEPAQEKISKLTPEENVFYHYARHLLPSKRMVYYLWCVIGVFDPSRKLQYMVCYCMPKNIQEEFAKELYERPLASLKIEQENRDIITNVLHILAQQDTFSSENLLQLLNSHYRADFSAVFKYDAAESAYHMKDFAVTGESALNKYIPLLKTHRFFSQSETLESFRQGNMKIVYQEEGEVKSVFMDFFRAKHIEFKSVVVIPLFVNAHFHGFLVALREQCGLYWTENEISLFKLFARVVSLNTERIIIQKKLDRESRLTSLALEGSDIYSWEYNIEKDLFFNNQAALRRYGYPDENQPVFTAQMLFELVHPDDLSTAWEAFSGVKEGKDGDIELRLRIIKPDGSTLYEWFRFRFMSLRKHSNDNFNYVIGTASCIEKFKQTEHALIQAKLAAEESNRLKSAFLANMSHEIRTPLNAIVGFSAILANTQDEAEKREYVNIIETNNALLLQLIGDILDLSKIEAGMLEFTTSHVDINTTLTEIEQTAKLRQKNSAVSIRFDEQLPKCFILTDRQRLMQVMTNFINNAMKFTREGSIRFGYRKQGEENLYFYVTDTGCGIRPEDQKQVFGRFVKLNAFEQGNGLGLSICESIIHSLGGEIGVESIFGEGSTFWFTIPYKQSAPPQEKFPYYSSLQNVTSMQKPLILIAEDDSSNYKLFEALLKKEFDLIHAWNGEEAVKMFSEHKPHLILMDIKMPIMDGYQATAAIRELSRTIPIIAVTAYAFAEDEARILNSDFNAYASKPVNGTIRDLIRQHLEKQMQTE